MSSERSASDDLLEIDDALASAWTELPGYRALYYRWETEQWSAGTIALGVDAGAWEELDADWRRALLQALAPLAVGQERATTALVPFVDAAPDEEQQVVLTSHLVDVARHIVFLDRFYAEVSNRDEVDLRLRLHEQASRLEEGFRELILERFAEASEQLRRDPKDRAALVRGTLQWHVLIEGTIYLARLRMLLMGMQDGRLPGLSEGLRLVARDLCRHAAGGLRTLREGLSEDDVLRELLRGEVETLAGPASEALAFSEWAGHHPQDADSQRGWAAETLARHLEAIGL